jgi:Protein of unknown function (DUF1501)
MITVFGHASRCCEGYSRREWLRLGGLGSLGLSLTNLVQARASDADSPAPRDPSFGRAKACIVLFMFGAPAHQDIWDLKPEAPAGIRGEFRPISSAVPGLFVGEHIPRLAMMADQYTLIRSVTHPDNTHTVAMHYMLTGVRHARPATNPRNAPDDFPCFGAVVNHLGSRGSGGGHRRASILPSAVSLNAPANQVSANNHIFPGFFAGQLGAGFDPMFVPQNADAPDFQPLPSLLGIDRIADRRRLLQAVDGQARAIERVAAVRDLETYQARAIDLVTSHAARRAFDLGLEPESVRTRYGSTPFGQGCLLARRLVEAGVSLVTVNWERDDAYWDTHANNFESLRTKLLPNMDRGMTALLEDLRQCGLLDETLIVWLGEFGRTPRINTVAGRDHWAPCNTVLLAGAGVPGGLVVGASDRIAAYPARDPVTPEDLAATVYHLLGIDPTTQLRATDGRPLMLSQGTPVRAVL